LSEEPEPVGSTLKKRLSALLLLVLVFGAPLVVTTSLVTQEITGEVTSGVQPGGVLEGTVVDEDGAPLEGELVRLALVTDTPADSQAALSALTDADGRFELRAPPITGHYELRAGGELRQRIVKGISFLDPEGETIQPRPVELRLLPGAVLELEFVLPDGAPAPSGTFTFDGEQREGGLLFGLVPFSVGGGGPVEDSRLRIDGVPPMSATLTVEFDTGEVVELVLEIEPGLNTSRVEL
jgi:hypothetical protein